MSLEVIHSSYISLSYLSALIRVIEAKVNLYWINCFVNVLFALPLTVDSVVLFAMIMQRNAERCLESNRLCNDVACRTSFLPRQPYQNHSVPTSYLREAPNSRRMSINLY